MDVCTEEMHGKINMAVKRSDSRRWQKKFIWTSVLFASLRSHFVCYNGIYPYYSPPQRQSNWDGTQHDIFPTAERCW